MLTREQLTEAAKQCAQMEENIYLISNKSNVCERNDPLNPFETWFYLAIQKLQQNAIKIDELLVEFDDNKLSETATIPPAPDEYRWLLAAERVTNLLGKSADLNKHMMDAIKTGDTEMVEIIVQLFKNVTELHWQGFLRYVIENNNATMLSILLQSPHIDPSLDSNYYIIVASVRGHLAVVERLLQDPRIDPSIYNNEIINLAAHSGHLAVVERLLQDPRVDPSAGNNTAISLASGSGHPAVVERLLQDPRVNPSAEDNFAIKKASENGHLAVVERLLQEPWRELVDPSASNNTAILLASQNGHLAVVERLLQDPRVDPSVLDNFAIRAASENGHQAVVNRLLQDKRTHKWNLSMAMFRLRYWMTQA